MATRFRLRTKGLFLTYAQIGEVPADALAQTIQDKYGDDILYITWGEELHEDGGRHVHALVLLKETKVFVNDREWDYTCDGGEVLHPHVEAAKAIKDCRRYCQKDGHFKELGHWPYKEALTTTEKNRLLRTTPVNKLVEDGVISILHVRTIQTAQIILNEKLQESLKPVPRVFWFFGATGSGKTRAAVSINPVSYWISNQDLKWFDGFEHQDVAIIDDFRVGSCTFNFLLRLLDRYKLKVPIKGGFVWWNPKIIVVTCPVTPRELYTNHITGEVWDNEDQLERRITRQVEFPVQNVEFNEQDMLNSIEED